MVHRLVGGPSENTGQVREAQSTPPPTELVKNTVSNDDDVKSKICHVFPTTSESTHDRKGRGGHTWQQCYAGTSGPPLAITRELPFHLGTQVDTSKRCSMRVG